MIDMGLLLAAWAVSNVVAVATTSDFFALYRVHLRC